MNVINHAKLPKINQFFLDSQKINLTVDFFK